MPSLFRFLIAVAVIGGLIYGGIFALANFVNPKPREITVTIPADQFMKDEPMATQSRRPLRAQRRRQADALFLDMLAAEQGAGANTIAAYRRDLEDLSAFIGGRKRQFTEARPTTCAPI